MTVNFIPYTITADEGNGSLTKAHDDDAAYDLRAANDYDLSPGDTTLIKTGVRLAIPQGFAGLVLPRSGLALKHNITVLNAPGLIDPGYRGEIGVILHKHPNNLELRRPDIVDDQPKRNTYRINAGDRIAQLVIIRTADIRFAYVTHAHFNLATLANSTRGEGGFGSTGR